jgi:hypothetical protein
MGRIAWPLAMMSCLFTSRVCSLQQLQESPSSRELHIGVPSDAGPLAKGAWRLVTIPFVTCPGPYTGSRKHNGTVIPLSAAPVGRRADGVDAMA